ncbi:MAG TPA: hypothetical protein DDW65_17445 [Firmicutes bacterium]|jgi:5-methyltetrahydrofolate--homocysteine methyltransferase|nr:hypothetical protein [Bacillota bacterium]
MEVLLLNQHLDLTKEVLLCDGAMGTMIQKTGVLKPGNAPELLNLTHPEIIAGIHRSYIEAGSRYIGSNTFGGNRIKLEAHGLTTDKTREVNFAGVRIAREAAASTAGNSGVLVAASLGPTGKMMDPLGDLTFEAAYETFHEQCIVFAEAGADIITVETMSDLRETKAAVLAALAVNLPVIATVSFMENGRLLTGQTPEMVAATLSGFPLLALGTNCGLSAALLKSITEKLVAFSQKHVIVQPNAGKPSLMDNQTVYQESAEEFANACLELVRNGVRIIGGCCGTSPEHIRLLRKLLDYEDFSYQPPQAPDYLVGKSSVTNIATVGDHKAVWRVSFGPGEPLWEDIRKGNLEPFTDQLLEIDPDQYSRIELDGLGLTEADLKFFQELVTIVTTYWPHPISAKLNSDLLIKALLTGTSGRALVIAPAKNSQLIKTIAQFGGISQIAK